MFKKIRTAMDKEFYISLNWSYLIVFVIFWSYGYQGAIPLRSIALGLGFSAYLICITIYFLFLGVYKKGLVESKYTFLVKDISLLTVMIGLWTTVAFDKLIQPIVGDHFYYSKASKLHEITAIQISSHFVEIGNIVFKNAIYWLDIMVIMVIILSTYLVRFFKIKFISGSLIICLALLLSRYIIISHGGGSSPHPPLQLFPIWLTTSIFSLSDFSLRIAQFMGLISCSFLIYIISIERLGRINSFFVALALCSIPLFIHVATLVEASIWTAVMWVLFLIQIISIQKQKPIFWFSMSAVISIFVLMRVTSFIAYPIFVSLFIRYNWDLLRKSKLTFAYITSPFLLCLPFLLTGIVRGTPATYTIGEAAFIPKDYSTFYRIVYAFTNGIVVETALSTIGIGWLFLLFGILFKYRNEKGYWFNRLLIVLFILTATAMFFSIRPVLWGEDKYKVEYLVPFIVFGGYLFFTKIEQLPRSTLFIPLISCVLIYIGINGFFHYPNGIFDRLGGGKFKRNSEQIYDYKSALIAAKEVGLAKNTILVGITYGVMPQILSGYTVSEVEESNEILKSLITEGGDWTSVSAQLLTDQHKIKLVLISDGNNKMLREDLLRRGWSDWKQFSTKDNKVVYGVIRG